MNINDQIANILEEAKLQIQANLASEKINASGQTSKSFAVRQTGRGVQLIMQAGEVAPAKTLELGLPANVATWGILGKIKDWIVVKRISIKNVPYLTDREHKYTQEQRNLNLAAGAITHKIINKGTARFMNPAEVIYTPIIEDVKTKVRQILKNALITTINDKS